MIKEKTITILIVLIVIAVVVPQITLAAWWNPFSWGVWNKIFHFQQTVQKQEQVKNKEEKNNQVVCTLDVKQCADGSYVGRVPPKCEFKLCFGECRKDLDCPTIYCIKAPCPQNKCINGECQRKEQQEISKTKEECNLNGGTWRDAMPQNPGLCIIKFSDAGETCTKDSRCQGGCVITRMSEIGKGEGKCKMDNNTQTCYAPVDSDSITCFIGDVLFNCNEDSANDPICKDLK